MLNIENLSVKYGFINALSNASISLNKGQIVLLDGHHGAGKSSLLNAIIGLVISKGRVFLEKNIIENRTPDKALKLGISLLPEGNCIFSNLTVKENIEIGSILSSKKKKEDVFDVFPELSHLLNKKAFFLSGGQSRMVAFARAVASNPSYLLLDEPLSGLSKGPQEIIWKKLVALKNNGIGVLITGQHNVPENTEIDHKYYIENGQINKIS